MPLDPISALGIASNVIQLVDFTAKLVSVGTELYRNGALVEHTELKAAAKQLRDLKLSTEQSLNGVDDSTRTDDPQNHDDTLSSLRDAHSSCVKCANDVIEAVEKLEVTGKHQKWQSFRHALSTIFKKDKLDAACQRLAHARQQLILFLHMHAESIQKRVDKQQQHAFDDAGQRILDAIKIAKEQFEREASDLKDALLADAEGKHTSLVSFWHSRSTTDLVPAIEEVTFGLTAVTREEFLSTLRFAQVDDRYDAVSEAHTSTYRWALEHGARRDEEWDDLAPWFESSDPASNIYWVTGQPGSGKSTLMKFLASSPTTKQLLDRWTLEQPSVIAQCYFWAPGTEIQKSLEGMLRTLLLQLLGNPATESVFIQDVCSARWDSALQKHKSSPAWPLSELKRLFQLVVGHLTQTSFVMVFVDGLDEYGKDDAQRQELVEFFMSMREISRLKICLSSRPWNLFLDAFRKLPCLALEKLNRPDIESYITQECSESAAFRDLSAIDPRRATAIRDIIVDKASGVFLWVALATRRLLTDMQNGTGLIRAEQILEEMPPGLDEYFKFMLDSIRSSDRPQAARIYQTMVWHEPEALPTLLLMSFAGEDESSFAHSQALRCESLTAMETRLSAMKRYLNSQSMDLLVYRADPKCLTGIRQDMRVDYLHRTVADFLRRTVPQRMLRSYTGEKFDVAWYCVNARVSQILLLGRAESEIPTPHLQALQKNGNPWAIIAQHFLDLTSLMKRISSNHGGDVATFFAMTVPFMLESIKRTRLPEGSIPELFEGIERQTQIDDLVLLMGMGLEFFPLVKTMLKERACLLHPQYYAQYLSLRKWSVHMLALIIRHTAVPKLTAGMAPNVDSIASPLDTRAKVIHFGDVFANDMRDIDFISQGERRHFSIFVDEILNSICHHWKDVINHSMADARLSWTVRGENTYESPASNERSNEQHTGTINENEIQHHNRKRRRPNDDYEQYPRQGYPALWPTREQRPSPVTSATVLLAQARDSRKEIMPSKKRNRGHRYGVRR